MPQPSHNKTQKLRDEKVRSLRIYQIDSMIRTGNFPNNTDFMKEFEVSRATVQRDMDFLRDRYNAPIEYDDIKHGYYYTDETFSVREVLLSEGELFSFAVIQPLLEQYRNTPLEKSISSIYKKLIELLPTQVSANPALLENEVSFISDHLPTISEEVFNSVFTATREKKVLYFEYQSVKESETNFRYANPLHIIAHQGDWYMLAFCPATDDIRCFSLARIGKIKIEKETFAPPADFKLEDYFDPVFGVWNSDDEPKEVQLLFEARMSQYLKGRQIGKNQTVKTMEDGKILVTFKSKQYKRIRNWCLQFGDAVKVLEPPELVQEMKDSIAKMSGLY